MTQKICLISKYASIGFGLGNPKISDYMYLYIEDPFKDILLRSRQKYFILGDRSLFKKFFYKLSTGQTV